MKRLKWFTALVAIALVFTTASCNLEPKHEHTFSKE